MTATAPIVRLEAVDVDIDGQPVLRGIDLTLGHERHLGIVGGNGSGKSTLLALIAGRRWPAPGRGRRVYAFGDGPERDAVSALTRIAVLGHELQDRYHARNWNFRARDVVLSGLTRTDIPRRHPPPAAVVRADALLDRMGLSTLADRRLLELSRGEQRRVLIARALAFDPWVLLLDEPAGGLDAEARAGLDAAIARAAETTRIVTAAHRVDELPAITGEIVRLDRGRIVGGKIDRDERGFDSGDRPRAPTRVDRHAESRTARAARPRSAHHDSLIEIENASVWVGEREILKALTWRLRPGEHWLVTGANGAGKSTFLRLLHGQLRPALGGTIRWPGLGHPRDIWSVRRGVALVSAELAANYRYRSTVLETVASGFRSSIGLTHTLSRAEHATVEALLEIFDLGALKDRDLAALSYGQRHRTLIARTLCTSPRVVLLDEPWEGLDPTSAALVAAEFTRRLSSGLQVVCASHLGPGALPLNRALRITDGRVVEMPVDSAEA